MGVQGYGPRGVKQVLLIKKLILTWIVSYNIIVAIQLLKF